MANDQNKDKVFMSADEVQQQVANQPQQGAGFGYGQQAQGTNVTPVTGMTGTPQSAAWRNVQATGNAKTDYKALLGSQPLAYESIYAQPMQDTLNGLLTRPGFQYDVNVDPLYQQIKDNYIRNGRRAMMDTQGQSAALSGGYGNSYGVMAGQQAYQESLGNLSDRIPELYQLAYNKYRDDETGMRNNLAALQGLDESAYQRYQYDTQQYDAKLAEAYKKYRASLGGGKKKKDPREDGKWFYDYSEATGMDGDTVLDKVSAYNGWDPEYTGAVREVMHGASPYRTNSGSYSQRDHDEIMGGK